MNDRLPTFKNFKELLGENRDSLFGTDATALRWLGFMPDQSVCTVEFVDAEGNTWDCDFQSMGSQGIIFDTMKMEDRLENDEELVNKILALFAEINFDLSEWKSSGQEDIEAIVDVFSHYIGDSNAECLDFKHIPIVKFSLDNELSTWDDSSWIEPKYVVRTPNNEVLLNNYASNMILGEGNYYTCEEIRDNYSDPEYLVQIVEAYMDFFRIVDAD